MKLYPTAAKLYVEESGFIQTQKSAETYLKVMRHCQRQFPDHHLGDFTTKDLAAYCLCKNTLGNTDAAGATVRKRMGHFRGSFRWWRWRDLVDPDPAVDLPLVVRAGKFDVRQHSWLTAQQVKDLYHSYDPTDLTERRDRLIIMLGTMTGLRLDAIGALRWNQFSGDFTVLRAKVKGDKWTELPILEQLADELREWKRLAWHGCIAVIPSIREAWNPGLMKRQRTMNWDRPLGEAGVYRVVKNAGERLGINLTPHDLRRTFAGWLEEMGIDLREIQGLLGHENIATTAGYLEKNPARLQRAVKGLRRAL